MCYCSLVFTRGNWNANVIDKANGYVFGSGEERSMRNLMGLAHGADFEWSKTGILFYYSYSGLLFYWKVPTLIIKHS